MADNARDVKRTVNRIEALRDRAVTARSGSARVLQINNRFEWDIITKALELLRQTISVGNRNEGP